MFAKQANIYNKWNYIIDSTVYIFFYSAKRTCIFPSPPLFCSLLLPLEVTQPFSRVWLLAEHWSSCMYGYDEVF